MKGKVWKFGNDIDTDIILPGRYLIYTDEERLSEHCMEGLVSDFKSKVNEGDFILGGTNFGCGSSREHAPIAIKGCGISAVIAESFARIFYRNATNVGVPLSEIINPFSISTSISSPSPISADTPGASKSGTPTFVAFL